MSETIRVNREALINMMSDKDHDTRIIAERQMLALLSQPAEQNSDPIQSIATQLGITTFGDGLLTKIRETIDLLQSDANNLNQFREITAEQYGHLSAATKLNEALQSELNEKRETIMRLLSELDAVTKIPCVSAMAKALSDKHADEAGVNRADTWKQYSHEYIEDVEYMLATAPHVSLTDEGKA